MTTERTCPNCAHDLINSCLQCTHFGTNTDYKCTRNCPHHYDKCCKICSLNGGVVNKFKLKKGVSE